MQTEQKHEVGQAAEGVYDAITSDRRVRVALNKIRGILKHPSAPYVVYVIGASAAAATITFAIVPLVGFTQSGVAAGSAAAAIQSTVYGGAVPAGSIFSILQSLGATGSLIPALVVGTISAGAVAAVRLLRRVLRRKKKVEGAVEVEEGVFENESVEVEGEDGDASGADGESPSQVVGGSEEDDDANGESDKQEQRAEELVMTEAGPKGDPAVRAWYKVHGVPEESRGFTFREKARL